MIDDIVVKQILEPVIDPDECCSVADRCGNRGRCATELTIDFVGDGHIPAPSLVPIARVCIVDMFHAAESPAFFDGIFVFPIDR